MTLRRNILLWLIKISQTLYFIQCFNFQGIFTFIKILLFLVIFFYFKIWALLLFYVIWLRHTICNFLLLYIIRLIGRRRTNCICILRLWWGFKQLIILLLILLLIFLKKSLFNITKMVVLQTCQLDKFWCPNRVQIGMFATGRGDTACY